MFLNVGVLAGMIPAEIPGQINPDQNDPGERDKENQPADAMLPLVNRARVDFVNQISFGGFDDHFIAHARLLLATFRKTATGEILPGSLRPWHHGRRRSAARRSIPADLRWRLLSIDCRTNKACPEDPVSIPESAGGLDWRSAAVLSKPRPHSPPISPGVSPDRPDIRRY